MYRNVFEPVFGVESAEERAKSISPEIPSNLSNTETERKGRSEDKKGRQGIYNVPTVTGDGSPRQN